MATVSPYRGKLECYFDDELALGVQNLNGDASLAVGDDYVVAVSGYLTCLGGGGHGQASESTDAKRILDGVRGAGHKYLESLRGKFSLLLYEKGASSLWVLRSFSGQSLYWVHENEIDRVVIATEIRQLHDVSVIDKKIDWVVLSEQVVTGRPVTEPGNSLYVGVYRFIASYIYCCQADSRFDVCALRPVGRYVALPIGERHLSIDRRDAGELLFSILKNAICRSEANEEGVVSLSGGMDSSTIFSMLLKYGSHAVRAYSMVFPGQHCDESEYIDDMEALHGVNVSRVDMSAVSASERLAETFSVCDTLPSGTAFHLMSFLPAVEATGSHVLYAGLGGDEWLSGSLEYLNDYLRRFQIGLILRSVEEAKGGGNKCKLIKGAMKGLARWLLPEAALEAYTKRKANSPAEELMWQGELTSQALSAIRNEQLKDVTDFGFAGAADLKVLKRWETVGDEVPEQICAFHGLQLRTPLMDEELMRFGLTLPAHLRFVPGKEKVLLRQIMKELIPESILGRSTRTHFATSQFNDVGLVDRLGHPEDWLLASAGIIRPARVATMKQQLKDRPDIPSFLPRLAWAEAFARKSS